MSLPVLSGPDRLDVHRRVAQPERLYEEWKGYGPLQRGLPASWREAMEDRRREALWPAGVLDNPAVARGRRNLGFGAKQHRALEPF